MDEQSQEEFLSWLTEQLGVESEDELQQQLNQMGDDGIRQAFDVFQKSKQAPMNKEGGKLEYLAKLQQGGNIFTSTKGNIVTDNDLNAYKKAGLDFGSKNAMGEWLDRWGSNPADPTSPANKIAADKNIKRYNQNLMSYESVPLKTIMQEPNSMTVGSPGAFSKWDLSQFKKHVTPADTVGQPTYVRNNVQEGWDKQKMNPKPAQLPKPSLASFAKGGSIKDKGQDGKTAVGVTDWVKGADAKTALNRRHDKGTKIHNALKGRKDKGQNDKTAVGITDWVKGKDSKNALGGRKDKGMKEHTALNKGK